MNIKLQPPKVTDLKPRIAVIGVGGAGGNAVNNMIASGLEGVTFVVANTDAQALAASSAEQRIQLGVALTEGLGAGSKPEIGHAAAEEALDEIKAQISGSHMVFVAAGMGGGTGTGAAAVIAQAAKDLGILVVGVVTKPFQFEGQRRMRIADAGIAELRTAVDTLIVIPNQNLFRVANEKTTFAEAFVLADQVLYSGIACIVDLIVKEGLINLDFADVRTIMSGMGTAMMGTGEAGGERRAVVAAEEAIANPLLDDVSLRGAKGLLLSIIGGRDLTLYDVDEAASRVRQEVDPEANIIVGATFDESLGDRVRVSIVASGLSPAAQAQQPPRPAQPTAPPPVPHPAQGGGAARPAAPNQQPPPVRPHPNQPQAHQPRPQPPSDDFTNALARAMDEGQPGASGDQRPRQIWRGPDDVTIEEGPPQFGAGPLPVPKTKTQPGGRSSQPFSPAAPVEVRRGPRRMPTVEDFPPLAQREYRARAAQYDAADEANQDHYGRAPEQPKPQKKLSLFQRITGFGRRSEPEPESSVDDDSYVEHKSSNRIQSDHGYASSHPHADDPHGDDDGGPERPDFAAFSSRQRGRR